jgi:hypothetical protein
MNGLDHTRDSSSGADHPATLDPQALFRQCKMRMTRRSGPGGQNRNKLETAVVLIHGPTGLSAQASERRTQGENRAVALKRLRIELALSVRKRIDLGRVRAYAPSPLWLRRCRGGRIAVSPDHDDFPAVLAEALDVLHAGSFDPRIAGLALGCSSSQLIKLLKEEPRAMRLINEARGKEGQRPLL